MPSLEFSPALDRPDLVAEPVLAALRGLDPALAAQIRVTPIDAGLADTAAFCAAYGVEPDAGANCIVIAGTRGDATSHLACVVLATTRADVNGLVRKTMGARRASFAPMERAVELTGMEFGGITPVGLPADWRVLLDARVVDVPDVIVGAGIRGAKLSLPGAVLARIPGVEVVADLARPVP